MNYLSGRIRGIMPKLACEPREQLGPTCSLHTVDNHFSAEYPVSNHYHGLPSWVDETLLEFEMSLVLKGILKSISSGCVPGDDGIT